jgi:membrane protein YdbS with pleckstrin-like domain
VVGSSEVTDSGVKVGSRILNRYLLRDERVEVATRRHWATFLEPTITVLVSFFLVAWIGGALVDVVGQLGLYLWVIWFGAVGRLIWKLLEWRHEWFCATDKRLLLTYGLFTHKVAMMPLGKVTDMNYGRSLMGRMLGYGAFTLESAGQDQALRQIDWISSPDDTYRRICDIIFGDDRFDSEDSLASDEQPSESSDRTEVYPLPPTERSNPRRLYITRHRPADRTDDHGNDGDA